MHWYLRYLKPVSFTFRRASSKFIGAPLAPPSVERLERNRSARAMRTSALVAMGSRMRVLGLFRRDLFPGLLHGCSKNDGAGAKKAQVVDIVINYLSFWPARTSVGDTGIEPVTSSV